MKNDSPSEKGKYNKWLALINIPIQMGFIIFVFFKLGEWLDANHASSKIYYYKVLTIVGVFIALYNVYRQVNEIGKNA